MTAMPCGKFTGIDFMTETVPDETTLCKFWHLLEENGVNKLFFDAINRVMVAKRQALVRKHIGVINFAPIGKAETEATAEGKTTAKVTRPKNVEKAKVTIPVKEPTPGTVVVIIHEDGTEDIIKTSVAINGGVAFIAEKSVSVKLIDNSKHVTDVDECGWEADAIQFAASHKLFNGMGKGTFSPAGDMTRGMLMTVLARLAGQDVSGGKTWYSKGTEWAKEQGLTNGTSPEANITREQLVTILYRYADNPKVAEAENTFADMNGVSPWAADAISWAVNVGILKGKSGNMLSPAGTASRAEAAAMLQRFVTLVVAAIE